MQTFFITFPQYHPLRDCWLQIEAADYAHARAAAFFMFGRRYGSVYSTATFEEHYFKGGRVGLVVSASQIIEDGRVLGDVRVANFIEADEPKHVLDGEPEPTEEDGPITPIVPSEPVMTPELIAETLDRR